MPDDVAAAVVVTTEPGGLAIMRALAQQAPTATFTGTDLAALFAETLEPPINSVSRATRFAAKMVGLHLFHEIAPASGRRPATYQLDRDRWAAIVRTLADYALGR